MTTIDFNALMDEAGEGFQPLPPGPYTVEVHKTEATTSSTQKPMIRAQLRVLGGPHNGRILFDQYTVSAGNPRALGFFFDTMAALGLDRSYFASNPPMQTVAQALLGRQCNVTVGMKQYQGIDRNEVKNYRPVQGGQPAPAQPVAGVPQMGGAAPMAPQGVPQQMPTPMPQAPAPAPAPQPAMQPIPALQQFQQQYPTQQELQQQQQQPAPAPVAPGEQQGQPQPQQMWQPAPDAQVYGDQSQAPTPQQPVAPPPGVVPPMPQVPGPEQRSI